MPDSRRNTTDDYLSDLVALCESPVKTRILEASTDEAIEVAASDSDVLIVSGVQRDLTDRLFNRGPDPVTAGTEHGTLIVYGVSQPGRLRRAVERRLF